MAGGFAAWAERGSLTQQQATQVAASGGICCPLQLAYNQTSRTPLLTHG